MSVYIHRAGVCGCITTVLLSLETFLAPHMYISNKPVSYFFAVAQKLMLLAVPFILFFSSQRTIYERDKVWYGGGYDPEYAYLFNSMNMANLRLVGHFDHPGTPMQVFGALVLRATWLIEPVNGNEEAVLLNPEHYLRILNISTAVLAALMVLVFGFIVLRRTGNPGYALIVQLAPFVSGFVLFNGFTRFTQEAMLMIASLGFASALITRITAGAATDDARDFRLLGWIAGFGLASKILFAPLMIIPLMIAQNNRLRKRFLFFSGVSFLLFTLPVILLYPRMAYWMVKLLIFSGQYGSGPVGIIDTATYPQNLVWIIQSNPVLAGLLVLGLIYVISFAYLHFVKKHDFPGSEFRLMLAVIATIVAGYLIVAKSPKESYLLPYEMLGPVIAVIFLKQISTIRIFRGKAKALAFAVAAGLSLILIPNGIARKTALYSSDKNPLWDTFSQAASSMEGGLVFVHPASSPVAALYFGNAYSRWNYTAKLRELYPDTYVYNLASNSITQMDSVSIPVQELLKRHRKLYIPGPLESAQQIRETLTAQGVAVQESFYYKDEKQMILLAGNPDIINEATRTLIFSSAETHQGVAGDEPLAEGISRHGKPDQARAMMGNGCIQTDQDSPFAFTTIPLILNSGDSLSLRIFATGMLNDARLVIADTDSGDVLVMESPPEKTARSEHMIEIQTGFGNRETMPKKVVAYGWNSGEGTVWFDFFSAETKRRNKN